MSRLIDGDCVSRLNELIALVDDAVNYQRRMGEPGKMYEGEWEISYHVSPTDEDWSEWVLKLHCYLIGPARHYEWTGDSFEEAIGKCEKDVNAWCARCTKSMSRMIDAEALIEELAEMRDEEETKARTNHDYGRFQGLNIAIAEVRDAPTVDAVPVVHGRWIDECCSECDQYVYRGDARNYCPRCGAKMDGGEDDGSDT